MNIIYTVNSNEEIIFYTGNSYVKPENKDNHVCNCEYCHFNTSKLKYNFSTDRTKAILIETDNEAYRLIYEFNKSTPFGVPLWVRGYKFHIHQTTIHYPTPIIMKNFPEYYRV